MKGNNDKKILIKIDNLRQYFPIKSKGFKSKTEYVRANDGININIYEGETFGLVGESGCGKSTLGRSLLQLYEQTSGRTIYYGRSQAEIDPKYIRKTLKNLKSLNEEISSISDLLIQTKKEYEKALKEDIENCQEQLDNYNKINDKYNKLIKTVYGLAGGLMLYDDLDLVSDILSKKHHIKVEIAKGKDVENNEKKLSEINSKINNIKKELKNEEKFEEFESMLDNGIDLTQLDTEEMRALRKDLQLIFQDPYSSLNPRMTVGQIISEGLLAHNMFDKRGDKLQDYVIDTMEACGLASYFLHRYPHQFSGGQRQRIGIARSVALKPDFIVCDEAVSALDVSIQSQIINLLIDLKKQENLTYLFISHDLSVIKYISDRVGVMYLGNIVELANTEELYERPMHPYTEALLSAIPTIDGEKREAIIMKGDLPSPVNPPLGCKFHTRCRYATDKCKMKTPKLEEVSKGHFVACHHKLNQDK